MKYRKSSNCHLETKGAAQRMFCAFLKINIVEMLPIALQHDHGLQIMKTGTPMTIQENMAAENLIIGPFYDIPNVSVRVLAAQTKVASATVSNCCSFGWFWSPIHRVSPKC